MKYSCGTSLRHRRHSCFIACADTAVIWALIRHPEPRFAIELCVHVLAAMKNCP